MAGQELEKAIQEIRKHAKKSMQDAYFKDIYPKVEHNPEDARFTEQLRLNKYYLKLLEFAQEKVEAAFEKDGVKWPGLVWEEHVNEKMEQPEFHYCTVRKLTDSGDMGQKVFPPSDTNPNKIISHGSKVSAATLVGGICGKGIGKLAGGKVAAISTAGTVLIILGALGLGCCLFISVADSEKGKAEVVKNKETMPSLVDIKDLLASQAEANTVVIDKWIDKLEDHARRAEDIAEKV